MSVTYEVLNARVKQKIDTESNWIAEEDIFGVIFEGEQAFVKNDEGMPVNFKIGDGTKKFSELPYFIAYYSDVTSQKVLGYIGSDNITIGSKFRANSLLTDIIIYNSSGTVIPLKIGTTNGGVEITSLNVPNGANSVGLKYPFSGTTTLYLTGITGKSCAVFLLYIQLDENPAIPPSSASTMKFPPGYVGIFREVPALGLTYSTVWDFATGFAKLGFGYDNCIIEQASLGAVSIPATSGLGSNVGTSGNSINLSTDQLPEFHVDVPIGVSRYHTTGGGSDNPYAPFNQDHVNLLPSNPIGSGAPISIQNYGIKDLWFKAVS
jgi:hypothetical protein